MGTKVRIITLALELSAKACENLGFTLRKGSFFREWILLLPLSGIMKKRCMFTIGLDLKTRLKNKLILFQTLLKNTNSSTLEDAVHEEAFDEMAELDIKVS